MAKNVRSVLLTGGLFACIIGTFLLMLNVTSFMFGFQRTPDGDVQNLERILPMLERYHVEEFRNQDWCKNIVYERGKFSDYKGMMNTCNLFRGQPQSLDAQATQDFNSIAQALAPTKVPVLSITLEFTDSDGVSFAEFTLDCLFCRTYYVYKPRYGQLPSNGIETQYSRITDDWYQVDEDWN